MKTILRLTVSIWLLFSVVCLHAAHTLYSTLYGPEELSISVSKDRTNHFQRSATIKEIVLPVGRTACGKIKKVNKDLLLLYLKENTRHSSPVFFNSFKSIFLADIASGLGLFVLFRTLLC